MYVNLLVCCFIDGSGCVFVIRYLGFVVVVVILLIVLLCGGECLCEVLLCFVSEYLFF